MTAARRSLATALSGGALASGSLPPSYTTSWDVTAAGDAFDVEIVDYH